MIQGIYTAIVTPFDQKGEVNFDILSTLLQFQMREGVNGIVILGTTGETPTLTAEEKRQVIEHSVHICEGNVCLIVGTGGNSTAQTIENTKIATELGADGVLIVTPYYNRPTQEGIVKHFEAIAEAVEIPIMLYNHPGRTGQNIELRTLKRLMEIPSIVGIKEASGSIAQMADEVALAKEERPDFSVMSGDDSLFLPLLALGGHGVVSVVGNLYPGLLREMWEAVKSHDLETARDLHYRLHPLLKALCVETNPGPIKCAMEIAGIEVGGLRLPLCAVSAPHHELIKGTITGNQHMLNVFQNWAF